MKVLHVLRQFNPGGIECWLDRLVRGWSQPRSPEFHFALEEEDFGSLAPGLIRLGARMHYAPAPRHSSTSASSFAHLLKAAGPFDAIHCHNHHASAFHLAIAASAGVAVRIAHSHADFRFSGEKRSLARSLYRVASQTLLKGLANVKLAVSRGAALDLFGRVDRQVGMLPCGADLSGLLSVDRTPDPSRFTLVHVGRMVPEKNHDFLLHVFRQVYEREPRSRLWLVGDGPSRRSIERLASTLGISRAVHFWGAIDDIPSVLAGADVFVFPSLSEGLGLAAIEAQIAGVPVLMAEHLPAELDLFPSACRRLAIDLPIQHWVNSLLELKEIATVPLNVRREVLATSPYSIENNIERLKHIYAC